MAKCGLSLTHCVIELVGKFVASTISGSVLPDVLEVLPDTVCRHLQTPFSIYASPIRHEQASSALVICDTGVAGSTGTGIEG